MSVNGPDYDAINNAAFIVWVNRDWSGDFEPIPFDSSEAVVDWYTKELPSISCARPPIITRGTVRLSLADY